MDPTKIVPEGPRGPLKPPNDHFRGYLAIFGPIWVLWLIVPNVVEWGVPETMVQNVVWTR